MNYKDTVMTGAQLLPLIRGRILRLTRIVASCIDPNAEEDVPTLEKLLLEAQAEISFNLGRQCQREKNSVELADAYFRGRQDGLTMLRAKQRASGFIQWKGTDACFDLTCSCGTLSHYDGDFMYQINALLAGNSTNAGET